MEMIQPEGSPIKTAKPSDMANRFKFQSPKQWHHPSGAMVQWQPTSSEIDTVLTTLQLH